MSKYLLQIINDRTITMSGELMDPSDISRISIEFNKNGPRVFLRRGYSNSYDELEGASLDQNEVTILDSLVAGIHLEVFGRRINLSITEKMQVFSIDAVWDETGRAVDGFSHTFGMVLARDILDINDNRWIDELAGQIRAVLAEMITRTST